MTAPHPLRGLARVLGLEPREVRGLLLMGALVAALLCSYTVAKVLRDALFLSEFGARALPHAYLAVAIVAVGFVALETRLVKRFTGVGAARLHLGAAIAASALAALAYPAGGPWVVAAFYLWTGSQAMMLIPRFWTLALELWDSRRARTVFPVLTGCGLLGALAGGGFTGWSTRFDAAGLLWTLPPLFGLALLLTLLVDRQRPARGRAEEPPSVQSPWRIIRRSGYLRLLIGGFALSVVVATLVDFQFKLRLERVYADSATLTQFLGQFSVVLNVLSLLFQFGVAGWLLQRLGLGVAAALQPAAILGLSLWVAAAPALGSVALLRWIQGALHQSLGKSCNEIYYAAVRASERRRVKPVFDTLIERWADAAVGALLLLLLHVLRVPDAVLALLTAALAAAWIVVLAFQDRQYGRAFRWLLTRRRPEGVDAAQELRTKAARRVLLEALRNGEHAVLALQLAGLTRDPRIAAAVRATLDDRRPEVRAAAVAALEQLGACDPAGRVASLLDDAHEGVRRAAVAYLLTCGPRPAAFALELAERGDPALRRYALDALFERSVPARDAITLAWVDGRLDSGDPDELRLAARALAFTGSRPAAERRLRALLGHADPEVRRAALLTAARRPSRALAEPILGQLLAPEVHHEAREALAAIGDAAVPGLERLLHDRHPYRARSLAAAALAQIGTHRAIVVLLKLARDPDRQLRHFGLRALVRARVRWGEPVLSRERAHRFFLRELREYRDHVEPARALADHPAPAVRLLAASYRESAQMALERAIQALACWYEPSPLAGVLARLGREEREQVSPALEYLEHVLPRAVFRPVRRLFETADGDEEPASPASWIESAWRSDDGWLRACAVRAAVFAGGLDLRTFARARDPDPTVRAELAAVAAASC